jgi:hypothetical protein
MADVPASFKARFLAGYHSAFETAVTQMVRQHDAARLPEITRALALSRTEALPPLDSLPQIVAASPPIEPAGSWSV